MSKRGRAVFFIDAFASHVYASLGLAGRLREAGYDVDYWGGPRVVQLARAEGFDGREIPGLISRAPSELYHRSPRWRDAPRFAWRELRSRRRFQGALPSALTQLEGALNEAIDQAAPRLAIFDTFLLAYFPLFWKRGVAGVSLSTKPLADRDPWVPPYVSPRVPSPGLVGTARNEMEWARLIAARRTTQVLGSAAAALGGYTHENLLQALSARVGFPLSRERVERFVHFDLRFRSVPEWAVWAPEMDLPRQRPLPSNTHFVGPCVDLNRHGAPAPGGRPEVYVSVGTIEQMAAGNAEFLRKVVRAFEPLDHLSVVVSAGTPDDALALGPLPSHIQVAAFQPQLLALSRAALAISHGGAGTLRESVVSGVPLLVYPRNDDQFGNAARVAYHRVGLAGDRLTATPESIRQQVLTLLNDPGYQTRMHALRDRVLHFQEGVDVGRLAGEAIDSLLPR